MQNIITTKQLLQVLPRRGSLIYHYITCLISRQKVGQTYIYEAWEIAELQEYLRANKGHWTKKGWLKWRKERCGC